MVDEGEGFRVHTFRCKVFKGCVVDGPSGVRAGPLLGAPLDEIGGGVLRRFVVGGRQL